MPLFGFSLNQQTLSQIYSQIPLENLKLLRQEEVSYF